VFLLSCQFVSLPIRVFSLDLNPDQLVVRVFTVLGQLVAQLLRILLSGFDNGTLDNTTHLVKLGHC